MNQPERRNPLTGNTAVPEFLAAIDRIHEDRSVRAVILTGAGTAFSSGGDIKDMERQASGSVGGMQIRRSTARHSAPDPGPVQPRSAGDRRRQRRSHRRRMDLACMCDIRIASEKPSSPKASSSWASSRATAAPGCCRADRPVARHRAVLHRRYIDAQQAAEWGLVSRVVPADKLLESARAGRAHRSQPAARRAPDQATAARGDAHSARHPARDGGCPGDVPPDGGPPRSGDGVPREAQADVQDLSAWSAGPHTGRGDRAPLGCTRRRL